MDPALSFTINSADVSAAYVTSDSDAEFKDMKAGVLEGKCQHVFVSPEQLIENKRFLCQSENCQDKLIALVIDEAHYVIQKRVSHTCT